MATVPSNRHTKIDVLPKEYHRLSHLSQDRLIAVLVVAGMIALIGLIIWLAGLSGTAPSGDFYDYNLWMGP